MNKAFEELKGRLNKGNHSDLWWNRKVGKIIDAPDEGLFGCHTCNKQWRWKDRINNFPRTKCNISATDASRPEAAATAASSSSTTTTITMKRPAASEVGGRRVAAKTKSPSRTLKRPAAAITDTNHDEIDRKSRRLEPVAPERKKKWDKTGVG